MVRGHQKQSEDATEKDRREALRGSERTSVDQDDRERSNEHSIRAEEK